MTPEEIKISLKNYLDPDGKLKNYPSKYKFKILALFYLASKFEPETDHTEKEVNLIIDGWHLFNDHTMLRRDLCDNGFLGREKNCSRYWLEKNQPEYEEFNLA